MPQALVTVHKSQANLGLRCNGRPLLAAVARSKKLLQDGVRPAPVDDVRGAHARVQRADAAGDLWDHAPRHDALADERLRAGPSQLGDERPRVLHVPQQPRHVRHEHELPRAQRPGDGRRRDVRVDVEEVPLCVRRHGGHHGHQALVQGRLKDLRVHTGDVPHEAQLLVVHALRLQEPPVDAREAHGRHARRAHGRHDGLVHLAHEDHGDHLHGSGVRDPQAAHEPRLDAHLGEPGVDLRPAAVDEHGLQAQQPEEGNVADRPLRRLHHRRAPVLDDDDGAGQPGEAGQALGEGPRSVRKAERGEVGLVLVARSAGACKLDLVALRRGSGQAEAPPPGRRVRLPQPPRARAGRGGHGTGEGRGKAGLRRAGLSD
mmetsp:Transcript_19958/g.56290  ORF Transcript_19958/g.56290 Transcript_19958/m.56290 type:complete len:374 (+) Transcript_19958:145-1266(+)